MKKIDLKKLIKLIPKRTKSSNKTHFGKALIIGSSKQYLGAGVIAALATTRTGAGYTYLMTELENVD